MTAALETNGLFASVVDGVLLCDASGTVVEANPASGDLLGVSPGDLRGRTLAGLLAGLSDDASSWPSHSEHRLRVRGEPRVAEVSVSPVVTAEPMTYVVILRDVTNRAEWADHLERESLRDPLTGLPSRAHFSGLAERAVARLARHGGEGALLFVDLDNFKHINDELGYEAGDRLLVAVARRLVGTVRADDAVARLGSDEFGILVEATGIEGATHLAERLLARMDEVFALREQEVTVTASIGLAELKSGTIDGAELIRRGDVAMYVAKQSGKARLAVFEPSMDVAHRGRLRLLAELRQAPRQGELRLHYQPQFGTDAGEIVGVEALVRWAHPDRGLLAPGDFIAAAEDSGLIIPIGEWVVEEAAAEQERLRRRLRGRGVPMQVNVSPRQLHEPSFVRMVDLTLGRHGIAPGEFGIEITESLLVDETGGTVDLLTRLHALGTVISVDDFGVRYSSLNYLRRFPIDVLKLDRSFIEHITDQVEDRAVARAIVRLGHDLGLLVVAEGVETEEQLALLREWRCDAVQGFLLARPLPADELADFCAQREVRAADH